MNHPFMHSKINHINSQDPILNAHILIIEISNFHDFVQGTVCVWGMDYEYSELLRTCLLRR